MSFGNWLNKQVKEIQEGYKQEEEQKLEAEAEYHPYKGEDVSEEDYNEYLDDLRKHYGVQQQRAQQDTDCDIVHQDATPRKRKPLRQVRQDRRKKKAQAQIEPTGNPDEWIIF